MEWSQWSRDEKAEGENRDANIAILASFAISTRLFIKCDI